MYRYQQRPTLETQKATIRNYKYCENKKGSFILNSPWSTRRMESNTTA